MSPHPAPTHHGKAEPCGCGGSGGACTCPDPCGDCATGVLERPRFFAGQLLTEDDLELLVRYVTDKGRLHNRHLHGAGVVCGLEVTCHPCGGGKIEVHPGHALDCCGNDILVPCRTELDVNALVRRLRQEKLGGHDCGDPCDDEARRAAAASGALDRHGDDRPASRRYCLYVEYCEEAVEPVAPYATEEPCGAGACEASRIREGYRFELRCPPEEAKPVDLVSRIQACIGDLAAAEKPVADAQAYDSWGWRMAAAGPAVAGEAEVPFTAEDRRSMAAAADRLEAFLGDVEAEAEIDERRLRQSHDALHTAARHVAASRLRNGHDTFFTGADGTTFDDVGRAAQLVQAAAPALAERRAGISIARDRLYAEELAGQAVRWTDPGLQVTETERPQLVYFAYGGLASPRYQAQAVKDLRAAREWLLRRLERAAHLTDCRLYGEVEALRVPETGDDPEALARVSGQLLRALVRYLADCICAALHPPCPPCDDPAVLLACLEVEDCEVVRICSLERTWVLTPHALRYWVPLLSKLGEAFEQLCCELGRKLGASSKPRPEEDVQVLQPPSTVSYFAQTTPLYGEVQRSERASALLSLGGVSEATARPLVNVAGSLGRVATGSRLAAELSVPALFERAELFGDVTVRPEGDAGFDRATLVEAFTDGEVQEAAWQGLRPRFEETVKGVVEQAVAPAVESRLGEQLTSAEVQGTLVEVLTPVLQERLQATVATAVEEAVAPAVAGRVDERLGSAEIQGTLVEALRPAVDERVSVAVESAVTERVTPAIEQALAPVAEKTEQNAGAVGRIDRALKNRLTATSLAQTRVVKDLRTANKEAREQLRALERSNKELQGQLAEVREQLVRLTEGGET